jgi:glycerol-3-phosphate dehydrogenase
VLGWDEARQEEEVAIYLGRVEAERISQTMLDDTTADEARRRAPDGSI